MKLRLFAASATLAAASLLSLGTTAGATPSSQAASALAYLATQQQADGSIDHALGETADYALAAKFHGIDPTTLKAGGNGKSVYDYFATWLAASVSCTNNGKARDGNTIGKLTQAVVAGGLDPTAFGGRNLLADLEGPGGTTGGAYDATTGTYQDCVSFNPGTGKHDNAVYAQANAILALYGAGRPLYPVPPTALSHLRSLQQASGAWATFGTDNTNATAMAVMALAKFPRVSCASPTDPVESAAAAYLHTQQDPASGGITYSTAFGTASDPDSDGLAIQAIVALGQDPSGSAWTNGKGNPASDILTFQDAQTGGFKFDHGAGTTPDAFTTVGAVAGVDRAPFPDGNGARAAITCPQPSGAPSGTGTAAPTPALPRAGTPPAPGDRVAPPLAIGVAAGSGLLLWARRRTRARSARNA